MIVLLGVLVWVLRLGAAAWAMALLVVVVGTFVPRTPVVGFLGSFVSGQYPLHAALAALVGVGLGAGVVAVGSGAATRALGVAVGAVGVVAVAGTVVVVVAQVGVARSEGVRIDPVLALTAPTQSGATPDLTARYRRGPDLDLDLYRPAGAGPHPVVVWVHGGSWVRGDRRDRSAAHRRLAEQGVAVVAMDYRLPPPGPVGEGQRADVARALGWVRDHAGEHDLDSGSVTLAGQSAGATLALATASGLVAGDRAVTGAGGGGADEGADEGADDGAGDGPGARVPAPRAVAAFYPVVDMARIAPSLQEAVFGGPARADPARLGAASPDRQVRAGLPPTLLVLGAADHFVLADTVRAYDAALRRVGTPGRLLVVPYADHVFDYPFGSPGAQIARTALARFVERYGRA